MTRMNIHSVKVACANCSMQQLCMPIGLSSQELVSCDDMVATRRKVKRHSTLFRSGEKFTSVLALSGPLSCSLRRA